jgi:hypothetical protein
MTLTCKGKVLTAVNIKPRSLNFGDVPRKESTTKKVEITRGAAGPLKPEMLPLKLQGVTAELKEIEPGERYEMSITVTPPFDRQRLRGRVELKTGLEQTPTERVSFYARLAPRVKAVPARVVIPTERGADWSQAIALRWDDAEAHKIVNARINDTRLAVRVDERAEGDQVVVLSVPGDYALPRGRRTITINTDDAESPRVTVPVQAARTRQAARKAIRAKGKLAIAGSEPAEEGDPKARLGSKPEKPAGTPKTSEQANTDAATASGGGKTQQKAKEPTSSQ